MIYAWVIPVVKRTEVQTTVRRYWERGFHDLCWAQEGTWMWIAYLYICFKVETIMIYSILMLFYILQFWTLHRYLQRKWRSTSSELQSTSATRPVIPLNVEVWSFRLLGLFLIFFSFVDCCSLNEPFFVIYSHSTCFF